MQERASDTIAVQLVAVSKRFGAAGETAAVEQLNAAATEAGARRALTLPVSGAFHSPLTAAAFTRESISSAVSAP